MKLERIQLFALYLLNALGTIFYLFSLSLQPYELSYGLLSSSFAWFCFALVPAILPLFYDTKSVKVVAITIGFIILLIQMAICYSYLLNNQIFFGVMFLMYWGTFILLALFKTFKWKVDEEGEKTII